MLCAFMFRKRLRLAKRLATNITTDWLLTCACSNMFEFVENKITDKCLATRITYEATHQYEYACVC